MKNPKSRAKRKSKQIFQKTLKSILRVPVGQSGQKWYHSSRLVLGYIVVFFKLSKFQVQKTTYYYYSHVTSRTSIRRSSVQVFKCPDCKTRGRSRQLLLRQQRVVQNNFDCDNCGNCGNCDNFNHRLRCAAPKPWLKYTTFGC